MVEIGPKSSNPLAQLQLPILQRPKKRCIVLLLLLPIPLLLLLLSALLLSSSVHLRPSAASPDPRPLFVEPLLRPSPPLTPPRAVPRLAYLLSGSRGDGAALLRVLRALYHPHNLYVAHLDLDSPPEERLLLAHRLRSDPVLSAAANVLVVPRSNLVTYRGPTMVANTLHAAALALRDGGDWDWFVNLSASDYPLVTQDDLLYVLSSIPRNMNFIEHTSDIGWKEYQRAKPVIIDPGLYQLQKSDVFWITEKRSVPTAFKLFTGSAWMMLSHQFIEYCLWGWDNLPRTVLMYYANFISSPEGYFHTVICNADEFRETTVNHDLHFISWDNPPKQHPHFLNPIDFPSMVNSNAPFARKFSPEEPVLDQIDKELLGREPEGFVPGGWLIAGSNASNFQFKTVESVNDLKPGPGAERLKKLIDGLMSDNGPGKLHCV